MGGAGKGWNCGWAGTGGCGPGLGGPGVAYAGVALGGRTDGDMRGSSPLKVGGTDGLGEGAATETLRAFSGAVNDGCACPVPLTSGTGAGEAVALGTGESVEMPRLLPTFSVIFLLDGGSGC